jgi:hypothetical protein
VNTLTRVATFPFIGATGAAISPDGLQVLIRRYSSTKNALTPPETAASYWSRPNTSVSLVDLLQQPGQIVALVPEAQGEAITFSADNRGFYSTGERGPGINPPPSPLTFYALLPESAATKR